MHISSRSAASLLVTAVAAIGAHGFTFDFTPPTQCGEMRINWSGTNHFHSPNASRSTTSRILGGTGPFRLLIIPVSRPPAPTYVVRAHRPLTAWTRYAHHRYPRRSNEHLPNSPFAIQTSRPNHACHVGFHRLDCWWNFEAYTCQPSACG